MWLSSLMLVAVFANSRQFSIPQSNSENVCRTPKCFALAAEMSSNLDERLDPCDDFYEFACRGWVNRHTIPEDKSSVSEILGLIDHLDLKLKALMDKKLEGGEPPFIKKIKLIYDSCMDVESIERLGSEPLKTNLKLLGGWPVLEGSQWDESKFDWVDCLLSLRSLGYSLKTLISPAVFPDKRNNKVFIIQIDEPEFGLTDRDYIARGLPDPITAAYLKMMVESAALLGVDEDTAEKELLKVVQFETALARITLPPEEKSDMSKLYNKYTVKELQERIPQIPWLKLLNGLFTDAIYENETLIITVPEFVKNFADLITKTDKRVIANYMLWRVVLESNALLQKDWENVGIELTLLLIGVLDNEPRWKTCLVSVKGSLLMALSSYYVRHYFQEETKLAATELVTYLREEFLNILEDIDWMDNETKKKAKDKAMAMKAFIGYPNELLNDTLVTDRYKNLIPTNETYYKNSLIVNKWGIDDWFAHLRKPNIKEADWIMHASASEVNAFYLPIDNSIDYPAAILQYPFFDTDRPNYMNFACVGSMIGHEITHGFDDIGRQYDKDGNVVNWWDKTTDERFREKAQCIISQYSNYSIGENGMKVNGEKTQGENIADNGGVKEAYNAYHSWVKDKGPEQLLPGIPYDQNQLFWISTAQLLCTKSRPEALQNQIIMDNHSPSKFRVNGPLSNYPEFSRDFNCSPDSPMNKQHKCKVW